MRRRISKKRNYCSKIFISIVLLLGGTWLYQFPIKKHIATRALYQLTDYDIFISRVVKDTKSGRGGVSIFFMVRNSLYEYEYDYSLEENNWLRGYYVRRGNYRSCDTLIFNDEE
ncbi:hypothetical protein ACR0Q6_03135 [Enterococcus lactis]|uniref:hypothetical protein n=1 Tax=Enterococcus lactis TaxID=357441 RepID=UPI003D97C19C